MEQKTEDADPKRGVELDSKSKKTKKKEKKSSSRGLEVEGYGIEGLSIAGHETCVIVPSLNLAFDIGKCPQRAVSQQFLLISHGHMDHIVTLLTLRFPTSISIDTVSCLWPYAFCGMLNLNTKMKKFEGFGLSLEDIYVKCLSPVNLGGLPMYVATRGLYKMTPPTIIVPKSIKENVEKLFEAHREMDQSELKHNLIGLDVGEEFNFRKDLKVKAFRTYHVIPSQGYIVYSVRQKLKQEFVGLSGEDIKKLKEKGVEITYTITAPEIAFTGDTMSDFIVDNCNTDVLKAKVLIMESTFVENTMTVQDAREYGHTHLSEIISYADRFENKAILLIHFSARYQLDVIQDAVAALPPLLAGRVLALTEGF
ncbi:hypothetical protein RJ639_024128 [Escallonia herrerae]|uniref:Uncharacterized protein n=1 Tax=Escallonia herrerae TaxID=1293975 RepID=A0AA89AF36_9ASTE|nr:hypothetical protein RJ639_024128 [Escallonia herrerae]